MTAITLTTAEAVHLNQLNDARRAFAEAFRDPLFASQRAWIRQNGLALSRERRAYLRTLEQRRETGEGLLVTQGEVVPDA
jgi:dTDP-4-dehydrorhamnose 3,5-epimerase-like enzyme